MFFLFHGEEFFGVYGVFAINHGNAAIKVDAPCRRVPKGGRNSRTRLIASVRFPVYGARVYASCTKNNTNTVVSMTHLLGRDKYESITKV